MEARESTFCVLQCVCVGGGGLRATYRFNIAVQEADRMDAFNGL